MLRFHLASGVRLAQRAFVGRAQLCEPVTPQQAEALARGAMPPPTAD